MPACCTVRNVLRIAALACFVAALWPHYSHTVGPNADDFDRFGFGDVLGLSRQPGTTLLRLGLPCSPLAEYRREYNFEFTPADTGPPVQVTGGGKKINGSYKMGFSTGAHFHVLSWSALLAAAGVALLVGASKVRPAASTAGS